MVFKRFRATKNMEETMYHINQMARLEADRDEFQSEGRRAHVLAVNFEMTSHASRALAALRRLEELAGSTSVLKNEKFRKYLIQSLHLPSIPYSAIDTTSSEEIDALYHRWLALQSGLLRSQELNQ